MGLLKRMLGRRKRAVPQSFSKPGRGPDFLVIGAMKCGTTSLFDYICQHPQVRAPKSKELHFYDRYRLHGWAVDDYLARFPERQDDILSGEATPNYLLHPHIPRLVANDFPDARLIAILRNPVDRAFSQFVQRDRRGKEEHGFGTLIRTEEQVTAAAWQRLFDDPDATGDSVLGHSYLARGRYAEQISRWLKEVPREHLLVLFTEHMASDAQAQMARVFGHLGLEPAEIDARKQLNRRTYDPMPAEDRAWLEAYFAPYNRALAELLGCDLPPNWSLA